MIYDAIKTKEFIVGLIKSFEQKLDENSEVAMVIDGIEFFPQAIGGTEETNLIIFSGKLRTGSNITFVQHTSQLSFSFVGAIKQAVNGPPRRIGF